MVGVHELQAYELGHFAGNGLILIRRGLVRSSGQQHTAGGEPPGCAYGGIDAIAAAQGLHTAEDIFQAPGGMLSGPA